MRNLYWLLFQFKKKATVFFNIITVVGLCVVSTVLRRFSVANRVELMLKECFIMSSKSHVDRYGYAEHSDNCRFE